MVMRDGCKDKMDYTEFFKDVQSCEVTMKLISYMTFVTFLGVLPRRAPFGMKTFEDISVMSRCY